MTGVLLPLDLLEQLMAIETRDLGHALDEASTRIAEALGAEKVDAFLVEGQVLRARGTSRTDLGRRQREMALDVLQLANGGRLVGVFQTGEDHIDGRVQDDTAELAGIKEMGVRSAIATQLVVGEETRGVLAAASDREDAFDDTDMQFLRTVARWVGILTHRAELLDSATRAAIEEGRRLAAEELVTVLAHDLGNDLTPLRGRLEFALRDARRTGAAPLVDTLVASIGTIDEIRALTADLLDVSRIDQGILGLRVESTVVRPVVERAARALGTSAVAIRIDVPGDVRVQADAMRFTQVMTNLLANAVKHSPRGGTVTVDASVDKDVIIRVIDEGPGVPTDLMPRVFMRYARGPRSTGLGLGRNPAGRRELAQRAAA